MGSEMCIRDRINPTLIKKKSKIKNKKILNNDVSKKINPILRKIVTTKEGTASLANVDGYQVGGKTGTAQTSIVGGYSNKKINTFASVFPSSNPKYVFIVMLDEPKTNSEYIYNLRLLVIQATQTSKSPQTAKKLPRLALAPQTGCGPPD